MTEPEELLKLIDGHIEVMVDTLSLDLSDRSDLGYYEGMKGVRWLVYNFFNAPRPAKEPSPLTEEELKDYQEEE
jgi:hypothetical protein